jgi:hypothetical protein
MATHTTRRNLLRALAGGAAAGSLGALWPRQGRAAAEAPRFLIVLTAEGGASVIDGPMAIRASESPSAATLNCYADAAVANVAGTPFRAVASRHDALGPIPYKFSSDQAPFVKKHGADMMVATLRGTSVNHLVAQRRAVTGNEAWSGRTLQEAVALQYGEGALLPNVHLTTGNGFTELGGDPSMPSRCLGEPVAEPRLWPLSLHGSRGTAAGDRPDLVARARALREGKLEPASAFGGVFRNASALRQWNDARGPARDGVEAADLISRLMLYPEGPGLPLSQYGLSTSPDAAALWARFPNLTTDPLDAQAALAFLLIKYRISVTVTLGPGGQFIGDTGAGLTVQNPPIAFDFSHQGHRATQGFMWDRIYRVADGLIDLLKAEEFAAGESLWDRTVIYLATDFGRTKNRPANAPDFGTGHDLNNGVVLLSPLVNGGKLLGGVDPATALTHGFDPDAGTPDPNRQMTEREIYAGILHALRVDTSGSGLPDMRAMRKNA